MRRVDGGRHHTSCARPGRLSIRTSVPAHAVRHAGFLTPAELREAGALLWPTGRDYAESRRKWQRHGLRFDELAEHPRWGCVGFVQHENGCSSTPSNATAAGLQYRQAAARVRMRVRVRVRRLWWHCSHAVRLQAMRSTGCASGAVCGTAVAPGRTSAPGKEPAARGPRRNPRGVHRGRGSRWRLVCGGARR